MPNPTFLSSLWDTVSGKEPSRHRYWAPLVTPRRHLRYRGHRRRSFVALDEREILDIRAMQRTFDGAYARSALGNLGYAVMILKIFDRTFYLIGLLYVVLSLFLLLISIHRRRLSDKMFQDDVAHMIREHEEERHLNEASNRRSEPLTPEEEDENDGGGNSTHRHQHEHEAATARPSAEQGVQQHMRLSAAEERTGAEGEVMGVDLSPLSAASKHIPFSSSWHGHQNEQQGKSGPRTSQSSVRQTLAQQTRISAAKDGRGVAADKQRTSEGEMEDIHTARVATSLAEPLYSSSAPADGDRNVLANDVGSSTRTAFPAPVASPAHAQAFAPGQRSGTKMRTTTRSFTRKFRTNGTVVAVVTMFVVALEGALLGLMLRMEAHSHSS